MSDNTPPDTEQVETVGALHDRLPADGQWREAHGAQWKWLPVRPGDHDTFAFELGDLPRPTCPECGTEWPAPSQPWPTTPCRTGRCQIAYCLGCGVEQWSDGPLDCRCQRGRLWWLTAPLWWLLDLPLRLLAWVVLGRPR